MLAVGVRQEGQRWGYPGKLRVWVRMVHNGHAARKEAGCTSQRRAGIRKRGWGRVSDLSEREFPPFPSFPFFLPLAFVPLGMGNRCTAWCVIQDRQQEMTSFQRDHPLCNKEQKLEDPVLNCSLFVCHNRLMISSKPPWFAGHSPPAHPKWHLSPAKSLL